MQVVYLCELVRIIIGGVNEFLLDDVEVASDDDEDDDEEHLDSDGVDDVKLL